jgi:hypothetical protein
VLDVRGHGQAQKREGGGSVVVGVVGERDDVEVVAPDALSLDVVRPRRSLLRGVVSNVFPLALRSPFPFALVPEDTLEAGPYTRALFGST